MKKLIIAVFCLFSFNSFGQILPKSTNPEWIGLELRPYEKTTFIIQINKPKHKFSFEKNGKVLYIQTAHLGSFNITNKEGYSLINYYDEFNGKRLMKTIKNPGVDTSVVIFGDNDVKLKIMSDLLPENLDIKNKHFVRFMCYSSAVTYYSDFAISLKKLLPPNSYTEPGSGGMIQKEYNAVVDSNVYLIFKDYILSKKLRSQPEKTKKINKLNMVVDIDFKHRYRFNNQQTIVFLSKFISYLKTKNVDGNYIGELSLMENNAEEAFNDKSKLPPEPN